MKMLLVLALFSSYSVTQAAVCTMDFMEGYDCQTIANNQTILVLNVMRPEHGTFNCESETIANFGPNKSECSVAAQALIYGVK